MIQNQEFHHIRTAWGTFKVQMEGKHITAIRFPQNRDRIRKLQRSKLNTPESVKQCSLWFSQYFKKIESNPSQVAVSKHFLSQSQKKVLNVLCGIPRGEVRTYEWLSRKCGMGKGYRAAGQVLKSNPFPVLYPCHRIIRKDGSLSGFSGGVLWKKKLLKFEGVRLTKEGKVASKTIS